MKRVTGIGGVFFQADDPDKLYQWYEKHLGIQREPHGHGAMMHWRENENPERRGATVWALFEKRTPYFEPSRAPFMLNYRVDDLDALLEALRAEGVTIDKHEDSDYGRFAWIMDPEGNKIELWEPPKE
jgi:predicted enzyme related to lactoylglutathione lyase